MDTSLYEQKRTIEVHRSVALEILAGEPGKLAPRWKDALPSPIEHADFVQHIRPEDRRERASQPGVLVLGFDEARVHIVVSRRAGQHLWHHLYEVEADLMIQRSAEVDRRLRLDELIPNFTRTVRGVGHGDPPSKVHDVLGRPDATRTTQAMGYTSEYYIDEDITVFYQFTVHTITDGIPKFIRERRSLPGVSYSSTGAGRGFERPPTDAVNRMRRAPARRPEQN